MGTTSDRNDPGLRNIEASGMQEKYLVLSPDELAKGFTRPYNETYVHTKCGQKTRMGASLAATYARDPLFYSGTFCSYCGEHFNLVELDEHGKRKRNFFWAGESPERGVGE